MRVGLVCPYDWEVPGGVREHISGLAEALIELGHEVSVIAPADDDADLPYYVVPAGRAMPVPYNGSVARLAFGFLSASRVRRWLKEGDFDVLHVHEPAAPSLSLLACWVADGPIVATMHAAIPRSRALHAAQPILASALEKISGRIAVAEAARSTLVEHLGGDAVLIPNGLHVSRYEKAEPLPGFAGSAGKAGQFDIANRAGFPGTGGTLGFLGRMDEQRKGLDILLAAFTMMAAERPDLRLLIAGASGDADDVLPKVPPEFRDRIVILGRVSDEDRIRMLHSVDVFCAPNTGGESFGYVLVEAMASGAAIVASDLDAFRQVLRGGEAGELFPMGDAVALADAAGRLLDDPARRASVAAAASVAVREFDWSVVARDVLRVYQAVSPAAGRVAVSL
jgi:phosphatidyl-myo-inositol alpha-mannosyltransferase